MANLYNMLSKVTKPVLQTINTFNEKIIYSRHTQNEVYRANFLSLNNYKYMITNYHKSECYCRAKVVSNTTAH